MESVASVIHILVASLDCVYVRVESCHSRAWVQLSATVQKTGVFLLEVLLWIVSHWQLLDMKTRFQLYVMCCRCCGSLSACIFVIQHIEWDATINGNSLLDFCSCSCFTLLSDLGWGAESKRNELRFFFMRDHYRGNHYKWSCVLFASTSVLLWLIFNSMSWLFWVYLDPIFTSLYSFMCLHWPKKSACSSEYAWCVSSI